MILIYVFGYLLNMFPIIGMYTVGKEGDFGDFAALYFALYHIDRLLPRFDKVYSGITQQVSEDYVMCNGFHSKWQIFSRHISRNILTPLSPKLAWLPMLVTGAIITETIYGWPGVGPYLMSATKSLDYPVIMAIMLLSATLVILGNLLADGIIFRG